MSEATVCPECGWDQRRRMPRWGRRLRAAGVLAVAGAVLLGVLVIGLGGVVDPGSNEMSAGAVPEPEDSGLTVGEVAAVAEGRGDRARFKRAMLEFEALMPEAVGDIAPVMVAAVDAHGRGRDWVEAPGVRVSLGWPFTWASGLGWDAPEIGTGPLAAAVGRPQDSAAWSVNVAGVRGGWKRGWRSRSGELSLPGGVIAAAFFFGGLAAWRSPGRGRLMGLAALALMAMAAAPTWARRPAVIGTFLWEDVRGVSPRSMRGLLRSEAGAAELASGLLAALNRVDRAHPDQLMLVRHSVFLTGVKVRDAEVGGVWFGRWTEGTGGSDRSGSPGSFGGVEAFWGQVDPVFWGVRRGPGPDDRRCLLVPLKNVVGVAALPAAVWLGWRACRTRSAAGCVKCGYELGGRRVGGR